MTKFDYEDNLKRAVQDKELVKQAHEKVNELLRNFLPDSHWLMQELKSEFRTATQYIIDVYLQRWFHGYRTAQPQLPIPALTAIAEIARENAHILYDPPEGEPLYSIEPIPLSRTVEFREWDIRANREPRTFTHVASFSNTGLQPFFYCQETCEWICL